jgi:hypothetical protein
MKTATKDDCSALCSQIYQLFYSGGASKAIAAQYLSEALVKAGDVVG